MYSYNILYYNVHVDDLQIIDDRYNFANRIRNNIPRMLNNIISVRSVIFHLIYKHSKQVHILKNNLVSKET